MNTDISEAQAAARHEILCNINDVVKTSARLLKYGGSLKMCQIPLRLADVICSMRENGIEPKSITPVVNRIGEKPWLFLISGKKGGKPGMEITAEFAVYGDDGKYTEPMQKIYDIS